MAQAERSSAENLLVIKLDNGTLLYQLAARIGTGNQHVVSLDVTSGQSQFFEASVRRSIPDLRPDFHVPSPFQRERIRLQALQYPAGFDPAKARIDAARTLDEMTGAQTASGVPSQQWKSLGPMPTVDCCSRWGAWTDSLAVVPDDSDTVFIGNPGSGVWKTTDGGGTWIPKTDNAPALAIGAIAIAPSSPNVVYAGTGNWWDGVGLLKSVDKGETWTLLPGIFSMLAGTGEFWSAGFIFHALSVSPVDPNTLLAGVWYGQQTVARVYRSADGGLTWKQVLSGGRGNSIVSDPQNPLVVYVAIGDYYWPSNNNIYKSTDGGVSWQRSSNGIDPALFPKSQSIVLSICSTRPTILYAALSSLADSSILGLFKTTDGGASWTGITAPHDTIRGQIGVHPQDPNTVFVGGIDLYRSRDGGMNWDNVASRPNGVATYVDHRSFSFSTDGNILYMGSDGGVFKTGDPLADKVSWTPVNDTLDTVLFIPGPRLRYILATLLWA